VDRGETLCNLYSRIINHPLHHCKLIGIHYAFVLDFIKIIEKREELEEIDRANENVLITELKKIISVLKKTKYIDEDGVVTLKGRAACEV
jgi:superfamily II RNA helicase